MPFSMQLVLPGVQTAITQALAWQYWPLPQSCDVRQRAQEPVERSQSIPSGVQVRSDVHFVWQASATQIFVLSAQSAAVTQAAHRPLATSHTSVAGQPSEFVHVMYGTHFRAVQSFIAGQSFAVTHSAHMAMAVSQTVGTGQSRLFRQAPGLSPASPPACLLTPPQLADHAASATTAAAMVRERLEAWARV
jgi:hypothetical protein